MGNVKIKNKNSRDISAAENESGITDPVGFFKEIFNEKRFPEFKALYEQLPGEQKTKLLAVFSPDDEAEFMEDRAEGLDWLDRNLNNPDKLQQAMDSLKAKTPKPQNPIACLVFVKNERNYRRII